MTARDAFRDGLNRVASAPGVLAAAYLVMLLVSVPLAMTIASDVRAHLGSSLAAEAAGRGLPLDWWNEFSAGARGLARSFTPEILGFSAVLHNLSGLADNSPLLPGLAMILAGWLLVWTFFSGGVLDRYARERPLAPGDFLAASGRYLFRLLRLGLIALLVYWLAFRYLHAWVFESFYPWLTRDTTVERDGFAVRTLLYLGFGALVVLASLVFDYARVRLVVEDRHSAIGAIIAAVRFIRRHPARVATLFALNASLFIVLALLYALLSPGARTRVPLLFLVGQLWIVGRLVVKLQFYASAVALFQSLLAHAGYIARPMRVWPDSPMAEAIGRKEA
jgi:hypothetical protein